MLMRGGGMRRGRARLGRVPEARSSPIIVDEGSALTAPKKSIIFFLRGCAGLPTRGIPRR